MNVRRLVTLIAMLVALTMMSACRTKKPEPVPPPPPPVVQEEPPPAQVEPPARDFVQEVSEEDRILAGEIAAVNREAQARGWIQDAFFEFDSSALDSSAEAALRTSASWLRQHPEFDLVIEGHCDERGTQQYNLALGERRANIARDYLAALGIESSRMRTVSYGEERAFALGSDESAWRQNRRAHLLLVRR